MENQVDVWISRIVGGFIALCVIIVFCALPLPALLGLLGIFVMEAVICRMGKSYQRISHRPSAVSINFVNKDFDDPLENADEKGVAFAGMDLCFAFGFSWILPVFPFKRFERNEVEVQAV